LRLRPALSVEAPKLVEILVSRHADSRYAGKAEIDEPYARKILAHAIHRHGGTTEGASFVMVAEDEDGEIAAFVFAMLDRLYIVGQVLGARDVFLVGRRGIDPFVLHRLFDAYVEWASANPRVFEIGASWSDVIAGGDSFGAAYLRRGFTPCGATYRKSNAPAAQREAA
jgi:hypothetical protein